MKSKSLGLITPLVHKVRGGALVRDEVQLHAIELQFLCCLGLLKKKFYHLTKFY